MKIKLTKTKQFSNDGDSIFGINVGSSVIGNTLDIKGEQGKKPIVGSPFHLDTYKTSDVQEILSENTFSTINAIYKWETIN